MFVQCPKCENLLVESVIITEDKIFIPILLCPNCLSTYLYKVKVTELTEGALPQSTDLENLN